LREDIWQNWYPDSQGQSGAHRSGRRAAWKNNGTRKNGVGCQQQGEKEKWATMRRRGSGANGRQAEAQQKQMEEKRQCQFTIGIEEESRFQVVRRIIGLHGAHVKAIAEQSGTKLRLRGCGSKFLEGPEQQESTDPLMLCVSAPDRFTYDTAVQLITELLERVYRDYTAFCEKNKLPVPDLPIRLHEGRRKGGY